MQRREGAASVGCSLRWLVGIAMVVALQASSVGGSSDGKSYVFFMKSPTGSKFGKYTAWFQQEPESFSAASFREVMAALVSESGHGAMWIRPVSEPLKRIPVCQSPC